MGYFDNLPDEKQEAGTKAATTKQTIAPAKASSFFDNLPDEAPAVVHKNIPSKKIATPATLGMTPKPTNAFSSLKTPAVQDIGAVFDTALQQKYTPSTPTVAKKAAPKMGIEYYNSPEFAKKVVSEYDAAPDKWKYKQRLTNLELDILGKQRPESAKEGSKPIEYTSPGITPLTDIHGQIAPTTISAMKGPNRPVGKGALDEWAYNIDKEISQGLPNLRYKYMAPAGEKISAGLTGYRTDMATGQKIKTKIDPTTGKEVSAELGYGKGSLTLASGIIGAAFSPLSYAQEDIANTLPGRSGEVAGNIGKLLTVPFEAIHTPVKAVALGLGADDETADDIGTVVAAFAPFLKSYEGKPGMDISTVREMAGETFKKFSEAPVELKNSWRAGMKETHPDINPGLGDSFFKRIDEAGKRGDLKAVESIREEAKAAKATLGINPSDTLKTSSELREEAKAGNENAIIKDNLYKDYAKETTIINDRDGNPAATIDVARYDDGKATVQVTVNTTPTSDITIPFAGEFPSAREALRAGIEQAATISHENNAPNTDIIEHRTAEMDSGIDEKEIVDFMNKQEITPVKVEAKLQEVSKESDIPEPQHEYNPTGKINRELAMKAKQGISFDPEKRGESIIKGFTSEMQQTYDSLKKYAKSDAQKELLKTEMDKLSETMARKQDEVNASDSRIVSTMIAGAGNFPVARMRKLNDIAMTKQQAYYDLKEKIMDSIEKKLKDKEVEEKGGPLEVLKQELDAMKKNQETMKIVNSIFRKKIPNDEKLKLMSEAGVSEKIANEAIKPDFQGFAGFSLTNLNNRIKDREVKLAKMEKMESFKGTETKSLFEFDGGKVVDSQADNRVQILFDEKPSSVMITKLKAEGWRWNPKNNAWQRFRNRQSVNSAKEVLNIKQPVPEAQEQEQIQAIKKTIEEGQEIGPNQGERVPTSVRKRAGRKGELASGGAIGLSEFAPRAEKLSVEGEKTAFKLSEEVKKIVEKLDTKITKYVSPGSLGTFYQRTQNIALKSVNDVSVVQHELSHLIDGEMNITAPLMEVVGYTRNGLPIYNKQWKLVRKQLTNMYVANYPGGQKTDKLYIRVVEGYATLQQKYLENPSMVKEKFPELYKQFIENAHDLQKTLNTDMMNLVERYQNLDDMATIAAVSSKNINQEEPDKFLSVLEKVEEYVVNAITRFEKLDKLTGAEQTTKSVADLLHGTQYVNIRSMKNVSEANDGYWMYNAKGEIGEVMKENIADLITRLGKINKFDEFDSVLIARDQYYNRQDLEKAKEELKAMEDALPNFPSRIEADEIKKKASDVDALEEQIRNNEKILPKKVVENVTLQNQEAYGPYLEIFDKINGARLDAMKGAGLISEEEYTRLSESKGYASLKRIIEDTIAGNEMIGGGVGKTVKASKISLLKKRTGGTHDIISPLVSMIQSEREVMAKVHKQLTMNNLFDSLLQFPKLAQELTYRTTYIDGRVTRTLGDGTDINKAKDVIIKMVDGKPQVMQINKSFINTLELVFTPVEKGGLEKFYTGASRLFTQGTTGLYPLFALTNLVRDTPTAMIHTVEGYNPMLIPKYATLSIIESTRAHAGDLRYKKVIGPMMGKIADMIANITTDDAKFAREYIALGGDMNTSLKFSEMDGQTMLDTIAKEQKGLAKFIETIKSGIEIMAFPANISEVATRMQEYVKSRKAGKGTFTALENAGRLTAPFHHKGLMTKNAFARGFVQGTPYLNAALQGLSQYISTAKKSPKGAFKVASGIILTAAVVMYIMNKMIDDSDVDTQRAFMELDPEQLGKYIFIPTGNKSNPFIKIAISQEMGWIGAMETMFVLERKYGAKYSTKEWLDGITGWLPTQLQLHDPIRAGISLIPRYILPMIEIGLNKKTYPSVRDIDNRTDMTLPSQYRSSKGTSKAAIALGDTDFFKSIDMSPKKIDHLLEGYLGRSIGYITGKPSAYNPQSPFSSPEYFTSNRIIEKFFNDSEEVNQKLNAINKGLITSTKDEKLSLYAQQKRYRETQDMLKDYRDMDEATIEANLKRQEIWKSVNDLVAFDPFTITKKEIMEFNKSEKSKEWQVEKEGIMKTYLQKYNKSTDSMKATKLERELKAEIVTDKKDKTQESRYNTLVKQFRIARQMNDPFVAELSDASNNDEKMLIIDDLKTKMDKELFMSKMREYKKKDVISAALFRDILKSNRE